MFLIFSSPFLFNSFSLLSPFLSFPFLSSPLLSFPSFPSLLLSSSFPFPFPSFSLLLTFLSFPFLSFPFLFFPFLFFPFLSFPFLSDVTYLWAIFEKEVFALRINEIWILTFSQWNMWKACFIGWKLKIIDSKCKNHFLQAWSWWLAGWMDALQVLLSKVSNWFQSGFKHLFGGLVNPWIWNMTRTWRHQSTAGTSNFPSFLKVVPFFFFPLQFLFLAFSFPFLSFPLQSSPFRSFPSLLLSSSFPFLFPSFSLLLTFLSVPFLSFPFLSFPFLSFPFLSDITYLWAILRKRFLHLESMNFNFQPMKHVKSLFHWPEVKDHWF